MAKSSLWSKKRKSKLIIIIPLILVAVASAIGIYSLKVYIALQEYFARMTDYNILVPEEAFFYYDNYLKVIIAFVIISFFVGIVIGYSVNVLLNQRLEK